MALQALSLFQRPGAMFVIAALIVFYIAARLSTDALTIGGRMPTSLRVAVGHFIPIGCVAIWSALAGRDDVAVGVVFATAVGALSLNLGTAASSAETFGPLPRSSRAWSFLLPASVMALMAGFSARLTAMHAILLLAQGVFVMLVWSAQHERVDEGRLFADPKIPLPGIRKAQLFGGILASLVAGWIGVNTANHISAETGIMSHGMIAAVVLSPLLLLPMIGTSSKLAQEGHVQEAIEGSVALALMNLCLLIPACVAAWFARPVVAPVIARIIDPTINEYASTTQAATAPAAEVVVSPMYYPLVVWRLDTVVLIVLSLLLLPVALGRWTIGRREGILLVLGYAVYLVFSIRLGARW